MSNKLVEIARFNSAAEAALARSCLDAYGIRCCLDGEAMATWFWHFGTAIGGVKLLVMGPDAERASAILSSHAQPADADSIDDDDDWHEEVDEVESDISPVLRRALRASILGTFLFPPILSIYSMYLLIRHRLYRAPRNWRVGAAISINVIVLLMVVTFWAMIIAAHEPPPTFYAPDGTPIDLESVTMPIVPDK